MSFDLGSLLAQLQLVNSGPLVVQNCWLLAFFDRFELIVPVVVVCFLVVGSGIFLPGVLAWSVECKSSELCNSVLKIELYVLFFDSLKKASSLSFFLF